MLSYVVEFILADDDAETGYWARLVIVDIVRLQLEITTFQNIIHRFPLFGIVFDEFFDHLESSFSLLLLSHNKITYNNE